MASESYPRAAISSALVGRCGKSSSALLTRPASRPRVSNSEIIPADPASPL